MDRSIPPWREMFVDSCFILAAGNSTPALLLLRREPFSKDGCNDADRHDDEEERKMILTMVMLNVDDNYMMMMMTDEGRRSIVIDDDSDDDVDDRVDDNDVEGSSCSFG